MLLVSLMRVNVVKLHWSVTSSYTRVSSEVKSDLNLNINQYLCNQNDIKNIAMMFY